MRTFMKKFISLFTVSSLIVVSFVMSNLLTASNSKPIKTANAVEIEDNQLSYKHAISPISSKKYCNGKVFDSSSGVNNALDNCESIQLYLDTFYNLILSYNNASRGQQSEKLTEQLEKVYKQFKSTGVTLKNLSGGDKLKDEDEFFDANGGVTTEEDISKENIKSLHLQLDLYYLNYLGLNGLVNLYKDSLNKIGKTFKISNPPNANWITVDSNNKTHFENFFTNCMADSTNDCPQILADQMLKSNSYYFESSPSQNGQVKTVTAQEAKHNALELANQAFKLETSMNQAVISSSKMLDTIHKYEKALPIREKLASTGEELNNIITNLTDADFEILEDAGIDTEKYKKAQLSFREGYQNAADSIELFKNDQGKMMIYNTGGECAAKTDSFSNGDFSSCYGAENDAKFSPTYFRTTISNNPNLTKEDVLDTEPSFLPVDKNLPKPYIAETPQIGQTQRYQTVSDVKFDFAAPLSYNSSFFEYALKTDAVSDSFFRTTRTGQIWEIPDAAASYTPKVELHNYGWSGYRAEWKVTAHYYDPNELWAGKKTQVQTGSNDIGGGQVFRLPPGTVSIDLRVESATGCSGQSYNNIDPWYYQYWETNAGGVCSVRMGEDQSRREYIGYDGEPNRMFTQGMDAAIITMKNGMKGADARFQWTFKDINGNPIGGQNTWGCIGAEVYQKKTVTAPVNAYYIDLEMFYCHLNIKFRWDFKHDDVGSERFVNLKLDARMTFSKNSHNGSHSTDNAWNARVVNQVSGNVTRMYLRTVGDLWEMYELLYSVRDEDGKWHPYQRAGKDWFSTGEWSDDGIKITGIKTKFETVQSQISIASHKKNANNWNEKCVNVNISCSGVNSTDYKTDKGYYQLGLDNFDANGKLKQTADPINNIAAEITDAWDKDASGKINSEIVVGGSFKNSGIGFGDRKCSGDIDVDNGGSECDDALTNPWEDTQEKSGNYMPINSSSSVNSGVECNFNLIYNEGQGFSVIDHGTKEQRGLDGTYSINSSMTTSFKVGGSGSGIYDYNIGSECLPNQGSLGSDKDLASNTDRILGKAKDSNNYALVQTDAAFSKPILGNIDYNHPDNTNTPNNLGIMKQKYNSNPRGKAPGLNNQSRLTQISYQLVGDLAKKFSIYYRVYQKDPETGNEDWSNWSSNGVLSGNADLDIYGVQIRIIANLSAYSPISTISSFSYINGGVYKANPKVAYLSGNQWKFANCGSSINESGLREVTDLTRDCSSEIQDRTIVRLGVGIVGGLHASDKTKMWSEPFAYVKDAKNSVAYFTNGTTGSASRSNINVFGFGPTDELANTVHEVQKQIHSAEVRAAIGWTLFVVGIVATICAIVLSGGAALVVGVIIGAVLLGLTLADMILAAQKVNHIAAPELNLNSLPKTEENYDFDAKYFKTSGFAFGNSRDHSTTMYLHIVKPGGAKEVRNIGSTGIANAKMFIDQYGAPNYTSQNYTPHPTSEIPKDSIVWLDSSDDVNQAIPNNQTDNAHAKEAFVYDRTSPLRAGVLAYGDVLAQKLIKYEDSVEVQKSIAYFCTETEDEYRSLVIQEILDAVAIVMIFIDVGTEIGEAVQSAAEAAGGIARQADEAKELFMKFAFHIVPDLYGLGASTYLSSAEAIEGLELETEEWYKTLGSENGESSEQEKEMLEVIYRYQKDPYSFNLPGGINNNPTQKAALDKAIDEFFWTNPSPIQSHYIIRPYEKTQWLGSGNITCVNNNLSGVTTITEPNTYLNISLDLKNYGDNQNDQSIVLDFDMPINTNFFSYLGAPHGVDGGTSDKFGMFVVKPNAIKFSLKESGQTCNVDENGNIHILVDSQTYDSAPSSKRVYDNPISTSLVLSDFDSNVVDATNGGQNFQGLKEFADSGKSTTHTFNPDNSTIANPSVNATGLKNDMQNKVETAKNLTDKVTRQQFVFDNYRYLIKKLVYQTGININQSLGFKSEANLNLLKAAIQSVISILPDNLNDKIGKSRVIEEFLYLYLDKFNYQNYTLDKDARELISSQVISDLNKITVLLKDNYSSTYHIKDSQDTINDDLSHIFELENITNQSNKKTVMLSDSGQFGIFNDKNLILRDDIYNLEKDKLGFNNQKALMQNLEIDGIKYQVLTNLDKNIFEYQTITFNDEEKQKLTYKTTGSPKISDLDPELQQIIKDSVDGDVFRVKNGLNIQFVYSGISSTYQKPLIDLDQDGLEHLLNIFVEPLYKIEFDINQGVASQNYTPPQNLEYQNILENEWVNNVDVPQEINCETPNIYWDQILQQGNISKCYEFQGYYRYTNQTKTPPPTTPDLESCTPNGFDGVKMIDKKGKAIRDDQTKITTNEILHACYLPIDYPVIKNASVEMTDPNSHKKYLPNLGLDTELKVDLNIGLDNYQRLQTNAYQYQIWKANQSESCEDKLNSQISWDNQPGRIFTNMAALNIVYKICTRFKTVDTGNGFTGKISPIKEFEYKYFKNTYNTLALPITSQLPRDRYYPALKSTVYPDQFTYRFELEPEPISVDTDIQFLDWKDQNGKLWRLWENSANDDYEAEEDMNFTAVWKRKGDYRNCVLNIGQQYEPTFNRTCVLEPKTKVHYLIYPEDNLYVKNNTLNDDMVINDIQVDANSTDYFQLNKSPELAGSGKLLHAGDEFVITTITPVFNLSANTDGTPREYETTYKITKNTNEVEEWTVKFIVEPIRVNLHNNHGQEVVFPKFYSDDRAIWDLPDSISETGFAYPDHYIVGWDILEHAKNRQASKYMRNAEMENILPTLNEHDDLDLYAIWRINTPEANVSADGTHTLTNLLPGKEYSVKCVHTDQNNCEGFLANASYTADSNGKINGNPSWSLKQLEIIRLDPENTNWYSNPQTLNIPDWVAPEIDYITPFHKVLDPRESTADVEVEAHDNFVDKSNLQYRIQCHNGHGGITSSAWTYPDTDGKYRASCPIYSYGTDITAFNYFLIKFAIEVKDVTNNIVINGNYGDANGDITYKYHELLIYTDSVKDYDSSLSPTPSNQKFIVWEQIGEYDLPEVESGSNHIVFDKYCVYTISIGCVDLPNRQLNISPQVIGMFADDSLYGIIRVEAHYKFKPVSLLSFDTREDGLNSYNYIQRFIPNEKYFIRCVDICDGVQNMGELIPDGYGRIKIDNSWYLPYGKRKIGIVKQSMNGVNSSDEAFFYLPDQQFAVDFDLNGGYISTADGHLYNEQFVKRGDSLSEPQTDGGSFPIPRPPEGYVFAGFYDQLTSTLPDVLECNGKQYIDSGGRITNSKVENITHLHACYLDKVDPDISKVTAHFDDESYNGGVVMGQAYPTQLLNGQIDLSDIMDEAIFNYYGNLYKLKYRVGVLEVDTVPQRIIWQNDGVWNNFEDLPSDKKVNFTTVVEHDGFARVVLEVKDIAQNISQIKELKSEKMYQVLYDLDHLSVQPFVDRMHYYRQTTDFEVKQYPELLSDQDSQLEITNYLGYDLDDEAEIVGPPTTLYPNDQITNIDQNWDVMPELRYLEPQISFDYEYGVFTNLVPDASYQISVPLPTGTKHYLYRIDSDRLYLTDLNLPDEAIYNIEFRRVYHENDLGISLNILPSPPKIIPIKEDQAIPEIEDFYITPTTVINGLAQNDGSIELRNHLIPQFYNKLQYCKLESVKNDLINSVDRCGDWMEFPASSKLSNLGPDVYLFRIKGDESTQTLPSKPSEYIPVRATAPLEGLVTLEQTTEAAYNAYVSGVTSNLTTSSYPNENQLSFQPSTDKDFVMLIDIYESLMLYGESAKINLLDANGKYLKTLDCEIICSLTGLGGDGSKYKYAVLFKAGLLPAGTFSLQLDLGVKKVLANSDKFTIKTKDEFISQRPVFNDKTITIKQVDKQQKQYGTDLDITYKKADGRGFEITNYFITLENAWGVKLLDKVNLKKSTHYIYKNVGIGKYKVSVFAQNSIGQSEVITGETLVKLPLYSSAQLKKKGIKFTDLGNLKKKQIIRYDDVNWLASTDITIGSGCDDKSTKTKCKYNPQSPVNRGAMADFMYKFNGQVDRGDLNTQKEWFKKDIATYILRKVTANGKLGWRYYNILWLAKTGVTKGCSANKKGVPTKYCPKDTVNRGAMAEFMYKLIGSPNSVSKKIDGQMATYPDPNFKDPQDDNKTLKNYESKVKYDKVLLKFKKTKPQRYWSVIWLIKYNITITQHAKYNPSDPVNRGSMAQFLHRLYYVALTTQKADQAGIIPKV